MTERECNKCHEIKDILSFNKNPQSKDGRRSICRECQNSQQRKTMAENPETRKQYKRTYVAKYPMREWCRGAINSHKRNGFTVDFKVGDLLFLAINTTHCKYCGNKLDYVTKYGERKSISKENSPTIDRINSGENLTIDDVEIICWKCNTTKLNRTEKEFYDYCKRICIVLSKKYGDD